MVTIVIIITYIHTYKQNFRFWVPIKLHECFALCLQVCAFLAGTND